MENSYSGLDHNTVEKLIKKYGYNEQRVGKNFTFLKVFLAQLKNPLLILIIIVAIISYLLGELLDIALLGFVIVVNISIGFLQEYSSEKTLEKLQSFIKSKVLVIRNSNREQIESKFLVPDDVLILVKGDKVPADGVLLEANDLYVSEAFLTGESEPSKKNVDDIIFAGSYVFGGTAIVKVTQTGISTKYGKIVSSLASLEHEKTYSQKLISSFSNKLIVVAGIVAVLIVILSTIRGESILDAIRFAVTIGVTIIPESLVVIITLALTVGAKRILARKGLVKKLNSVENLGLATTLCIDKTGTLTEGKMKVSYNGIEDSEQFEKAINLLNEQKTPIEIALLDFASSKNSTIDYGKYKRGEYKAFDSANKYTAGVFKNEQDSILLVMGTPYTVLDFCEFEEKEYERVKNLIDTVAKKGQKLIAVAYKKDEDKIITKNLIWGGFIGIDDNIRSTASKSLLKIREAGIAIKILTGDNKFTAMKIVKNLGIDIDEDEIIEGRDLDNITDDEIVKAMLFTNITPEHKLKIVTILKERGEVITMIGDGINDVLALRKADVAVSMGDSSDTALEEGDLILLNNELDTIVKTIEQGRLAFRNIQNIISYVLSNSFSEVIIITLSFIFKLPFPFIIPQILWLHMICDGPLDFSLVFEKNTDGLMHATHRARISEGLINKKTFFIVSLISTYIGIFIFVLFRWIYLSTGDIDLARTVIFIASAISSVYYIYSFKNLNTPIWRIRKILKNSFLNVAVLGSSLLAILPLLIQSLGRLFKISALNLQYILIIIAFEITLLFWVEFVKYVVNEYVSVHKLSVINE